MTGIKVSAERDRVVLSFSARLRDLQLKSDEARGLAVAIEAAADHCELWEKAGGRPQLLRGGTRGALVKSWDGRVNVRLDDITDRESIPYAFARLLGAELRAKAVEAEARVTIQFTRSAETVR